MAKHTTFIFASVLTVLLMAAPSFAVDLKHGESQDFTITATIPADPSLSHHELTVDFRNDGAGFIVDEVVAATDPLGGYEFTYTFTYTVPDHITLGAHSLYATLNSVDQADNKSAEASAEVAINIVDNAPPIDTTPPSTPTGLTITITLTCEPFPECEAETATE